MMPSISVLLLITAFFLTIASATTARIPLWIPVLLAIIAALLGSRPLVS